MGSDQTLKAPLRGFFSHWRSGATPSSPQACSSFLPRADPPTGAVLGRLHALQAELGYLPPEELRRVADELGTPLARVYGAASFYGAFRFAPRGRCTIQVCLGTACYLRGAGRLLEELASTLGVEPGQTTRDRLFTLETVYCVGSCALSPVLRVGGETYGRVAPGDVAGLLASFRTRLRELSGEEPP